MFYTNTVSNDLLFILNKLMDSDVFSSFRLVGGTALSLQIGHRKSVDIDLFSDSSYGEISFEKIDQFLASNFEILEYSKLNPSLGRSYFVGNDSTNLIKLDVYYTDKFIFPSIDVNGVRMADISEISAMKVDVVQRIGRKKDFWDLHELLRFFSIEEMINLHKLKYPFNHSHEIILKNFVNFNEADDDFEPICLLGKHWELIKFDFEELVYPLM